MFRMVFHVSYEHGASKHFNWRYILQRHILHSFKKTRNKDLLSFLSYTVTENRIVPKILLVLTTVSHF